MEGGNGNQRSSFSQPWRSRRQNLASNALHQSKVSNFAQRSTPSSTSTTGYASTSSFNESQDHDAPRSSDSGPIVGTCPYMCPGKKNTHFIRKRCIYGGCCVVAIWNTIIFWF